MTLFNIVPIFGFLFFLLVAWALSSNRKKINWRLVVIGLGFQFLLAGLLSVLTVSMSFVELVGDLWRITSSGVRFIMGASEVTPAELGESDAKILYFAPLFFVLPHVIFFTAITSLLYHFKIMQMLSELVGKLVVRLRLTGEETIASLGSFSFGFESMYLARPRLEKMSAGELCTIMAVGMTAFNSTLTMPLILTLPPVVLRHLFFGSLLAMPAAFVLSKIILPEDSIRKKIEAEPPAQGLINALISGGRDGLKVIGNIIILVVVVMGLISVINYLLSFPGERINTLAGTDINTSLEGLMTYLFYPVALLTGVPPVDAMNVAHSIATRFCANEVMAIKDLVIALDDKTIGIRSAAIGLFAISGFANLTALAVFVGGLVALAPNRSKESLFIGLRALLAATLACLMSACIAGVLPFFNGN